MSSPYSQTSRVTTTGIATAAILLVSLSMATALVVDRLAVPTSADAAIVAAKAKVTPGTGPL